MTDKVEKIAKELMKHIGELEAITSRDISVMFDIDDNDTFIKTRGLIKEAMVRYNLPLGSQTSGKNAGYFLIKDEKVLLEKYNSLMRRSTKIQNRALQMLNNYSLYWNKTPAFATEIALDDEEI